MGFTTIVEFDDKQTAQLDATTQITLLSDPTFALDVRERISAPRQWESRTNDRYRSSVKGADGVREYRLSSGPVCKSFAPAIRPPADDTGLFIIGIVSVEAHLFAMAMKRAYFQDLMNCRWQVKRFGGSARAR